MEATLIDPRDVSWEVDSPAYRVYFWGRPSPTWAWQCEEWRLTAAHDVHEVLAWADGRAGDRTFTVQAEVDVSGEGRGMIRLAGTDPTRTGAL